MAIPGLKPVYEIRAKVRVGEKNARGLPTSTDHFVCDEAVFQRLTRGEDVSQLTILFPFADPSDNFTTGLEFWRGKQLSCYSKGDKVNGRDAAYRVNALIGDFEVIGEPMGRGKERTPIACAFRDCPNFKDKTCKPMGRLQFFIEGAPMDSVYQLDTKSWNTIEGLEGALGLARASGDLRGRRFILSVAIVQKATQKFPVVSLKEADVKIETSDDVLIADQLIHLRIAVDEGTEQDAKRALASSLDVTNPGWRDKPEFIARIAEVGAVEAAKGLLKKYDA